MDDHIIDDFQCVADDVTEKFSDKARAFASALEQGVLSGRRDRDNFIGHYMFMGNDEHGKALFKHSDTRSYLDPVGYGERWVAPKENPQLFVNAVCEAAERDALGTRIQRTRAEFAKLARVFIGRA